MAPVKQARDIKITVPRHNSQRISTKLSTELKKQGKARGVLLQTGQPSSRLAQAIESASEWNSLLMTARAERGPQWDVGTQQFLVDKYSGLYYDPTPLFEAVKEEEGPEDSPLPPQIQRQPSMPQSSQHIFQIQQTHSNTSTRSHHTPRRDIPGDMGMPPVHMREQSPHRPGGYPGSPAGISPMNMNMNMGMNMGMGMGMGMRGPPGGGGPYPGAGGGPPFNPTGHQFMSGGDLTSGGSPMRMGGGMVNMGMGGGMRPNMAGMAGMGGLPGNMGGAGMGGIPLGGGMGGPALGGGMGAHGMGGMGGGGMMNMGGMGPNMAGGMGGMGPGMGGGMSNMNMGGPGMGMGMGMGNMGVDMGLGMNMSPRGMRGVPDDGGFPPIH